MRPPLSYVPSLFPLAGYIAGILLGDVLPVAAAIAVAVAGAVVLAAMRRMAVGWRPAGLLLLFMGGGVVAWQWQRPIDPGTLHQGSRVWQGEVVEVADNDKGYHLTVRLDSVANGARSVDVLLHTKHGGIADGVAPGAVVRFSCELEAAEGDLGPVAVDYAALLARRGIVAVGFADAIDVVGQREGWRSLTWRWRARAEKLLMSSSLSDDACFFLVAVLMGDDDWLSQSLRDTFSSAGLAHVLALSGLHVGIIVMLLGLLLLPLGLVWDWRVRCAVVIAVLWGYALLTGMSASVTRAVLMASMVSGGIILQRPYVAMNGLLVAALIVLVVAPGQLLMPGFQMSFLAVASILLLMPALMPWMERMPRWLRWLAMAAALSVVAMAGTAMVALYYFHIFPVYFLLANLPVALMLPPLMVGGLLLMGLEALGLDPAWLCTAIDVAYSAMYRWAVAVVGMPSATLRDVYVGGVVLVPYYFALCCAAMALWRRSVGWGVAMLGAIIATVVAAQLVTAQKPLPRWFIPRDAYFTSIVYRSASDGMPTLLTTASGQACLALRQEYAWRYRRYLAAASVDSLAVASGWVAHLHGDSLVGPALRIVLVADDSLVGRPPAEAVEADYAVVCRGYRRGWREVADSLRPRALLLSADIPKRRHLAILDSIAADTAYARRIEVISLRDATFTATAGEADAK